jgi:uncharacterized RDD family membrane protein YckC
MSDEGTGDAADLPAPRDHEPTPSADQSAYLPPTWDVPDTVPDHLDGELAGYGWRVLGYLIDALIVGVALGIFSKVAQLSVYTDLAVGYVVRALYAGLLIAYWRGQTVGMKAVKLVCVDASSRDEVPVAQSMIRAFTAEIIAALSLFGLVLSLAQVLDLLWPAWDKMNQTLHDKVGRTVVVR